MKQKQNFKNHNFEEENLIQLRLTWLTDDTRYKIEIKKIEF
jgi:hypothetical protein